MLDEHLFLVGYRGSGKTSVAKILSQRLGCGWIDSDVQIEETAGRSIREIFSSDGEAAFRDLESQAVASIVERPPLAVALGGGAILRPENRALLQAAGNCVWLTASPEELAKRIASDETTAARRPALTNLAGYDEIIRLLAEREPLYREVASLTVRTDQLDPDSIAEQIIEWLARRHLARGKN